MSARQLLLTALRHFGLISLFSRIHQVWLNLIKWICRMRGKPHLSAIYNDSFFVAEEEWTKQTAEQVVQIILRAFPVHSVVDVGCGSAIYLRVFQTVGLEVKGYEGSLAGIQRAAIDHSLIEQVDLTQPLISPRTYDLAVCFEVAEHLPPAAADTLVNSLSKLSSTILFSAAQPGQGGFDHINEQLPSYWTAKFAAVDFTVDETQTVELRKAFGADGGAWWLEKNLIVLRKKPHPSS